MSDVYQFPPNKRASWLTKFQQLEKISEEHREVQSAMLFETNERVIEEVWDEIFACEGLLRKFPEDMVKRGKEAVLKKAELRNDLL